MIITLANETGGTSKTMLASSLATMRRLAGRSVLLLDNDPHHPSVDWHKERQNKGKQAVIATRPMTGKGMQPELEYLVSRYQDIVIDSESRDSMGSRSALSAADVAVIAFDLDYPDQVKQEKLCARIVSAHLNNTRLRTLVVMTSSEPAPGLEKITIAREFVSKIPAAGLFHSAIHTDGRISQGFRDGLTIDEIAQSDNFAIDEMHDLCHEVFDY